MYIIGLVIILPNTTSPTTQHCQWTHQ